MRSYQIDQQLSVLKKQMSQLMAPKQGWIRTIRKALGLTIKQLAQRLDVHPSRVVKIETAEVQGSVTLQTLQTVAKALNCYLIYNFVPQSTFEETVKNKALEIARKQIERTSHTMSLEAQSVNPQWTEMQINMLAQELLQHSWKHLWDE